MGHRDSGFRNQIAQTSSDMLDVHHPVVHVEHLTFTQQLTADRLAHRSLLVVADVGEDRLAVGWRRIEHRHVADAGEAHLHGARNRCCRESEDVDVGAQRLDRLLVLDPESLLLVDHEQAEILEHDIGRQQPVSADDQIDRPVPQPVHHELGLSVGEEPAENLDPKGVRRETIAERLMVLLGQKGGGHENGDLTTVLYGLERRSNGDLGLSEPDVADDESIHGCRAFHVGLHIDDRLKLIAGLLVGERRLELHLPRRVRGIRVPRRGHPLLVEDHQLLGHLLHR